MSDGEDQRKFEEAIRTARLGGMHSFQRWFNRSSDVQQSLVRGYWDLSLHILTPKVCEYIQHPEEKTALTTDRPEEVGRPGCQSQEAVQGDWVQRA
jgi:hypothetical protein